MNYSREQARGGGGTGDTSLRPPNFFSGKEAPRGFLFQPFWAASLHCFFFVLFLLHCLDSMSERLLGRITSNNQ